MHQNDVQFASRQQNQLWNMGIFCLQIVAGISDAPVHGHYSVTSLYMVTVLVTPLYMISICTKGRKKGAPQIQRKTIKGERSRPPSLSSSTLYSSLLQLPKMACTCSVCKCHTCQCAKCSCTECKCSATQSTSCKCSNCDCHQ